MVSRNKVKSWSRVAVAVVLLLSGLLPIFDFGRAQAYQLMTERYVQLSSSADGTLADGQDVTYKVGFKIADDSQSIGGIVIEFCANSPIIGDSCTAPTGFDVDADGTGDGTALALTDVAGNLTTFTIDTGTSTANKIVLNAGTPQAITSGTAVEFDFGTAAAADGIDNPENTNTSFYGRILTFPTATGADQYTSADIDNSGANTVLDAGGTAMSTANQITVTAKVPERLTFCVFTQDDTGAPDTCGQGSGANGDLTGNAVTLGDNNGVLSDLEEFVNKQAKYTVATNALYNVSIRMKGSTLKTTPTCGDTDGLTCSIDAMTDGVTDTYSEANSPGSEQFGVCTYAATGATTLAPVAPYDNVNCSGTTDNSGVAGNNTPNDADNGAQFALWPDATDGTNSTYGDVLATKQPGAYSTGVLAFIGNISVTTEPGIYQSTFTFVATGTY